MESMLLGKDHLIHQGTNLERKSLRLIPHQRHGILGAFIDADSAAHTFFVNHVIDAIYDLQGVELTVKIAVAAADA